MEIASLIALFGWMTVINFALLIFSTLILTMFRTAVIRVHTRVTGLEENALKPVYLYFLGFYKVLIILFNLVPYLALKLI
ncbi:DUF6868 family protein [Methylophaga sp. OBS1]|uniref:DUF6868 family protein n=1 Tax=Methylophaga sp. OBS1 TaxID=2991933 RepID=UPI0022576AF1|nr:hypothetical protein [Methylophaga sp. OBS1]MCX4193653.1 hypothetical protein [Methylophaga sp. OBS1]